MLARFTSGACVSQPDAELQGTEKILILLSKLVVWQEVQHAVQCLGAALCGCRLQPAAPDSLSLEQQLRESGDK